MGMNKFPRNANSARAIGICESGKWEGGAVDGDFFGAEAILANLIEHFEAYAVGKNLCGEAVQGNRDYGIDNQRFRLRANAKECVANQPGGDPRAAGINAPAAFERNRTIENGWVMGIGRVAIGKSGI